MDLKILFSPVSESLYQQPYNAGALFHAMSVFGDAMPDHRQADIALFGVKEDRGSPHNKGCGEGPDEIRKKLYLLQRGNANYRIVDLGNLNVGISIEETYIRIGEVCRMLLENDTLPVLLGGSHDLDYGQYQGYEEMDKLISLLNIDAFLDLEDTPDAAAASTHIHKILLHEPNYLFGYTHLAHQAYLINPSGIAFLEKLYFEAYRIGQLRGNAEEVEPAVRAADMVSFDITAIRSTDAPGNARAQPFGLTGEEACQICWYAGLNEKLSSIGFYEYNPSRDDAKKKTASVVATMVWYFIEGYYHRNDKKNFRSNDFIKYTVPLSTAEPETLTFYKSKSTEKWWMEVYFYRASSRYARASIVPCSYKDYQTATQGDLPERYILAISRST